MEERGKWNWNDRELLRYLGYHGQDLSEQVETLIQQCKQELLEAAELRFIWQEYPLKIQDHVIDLGILKTESRSLERNLKDCEKVFFFAATLGSRVDMLLQRYSRIQVSKAVVMQAAAVAMLETYCDEKNQELKEQCQREGWYLRPRFSPGYGDFPLECQRRITAALELSKKVGIMLTESLLMVPSKSITAVIGASRIPKDCSVQGCEVCTKRDCLYRR